MDFVLKAGNLERYVENARSIRSKLTENQHGEMESLGQRLFSELFSEPDEADSDGEPKA